MRELRSYITSRALLPSIKDHRRTRASQDHSGLRLIRSFRQSRYVALSSLLSLVLLLFPVFSTADDFHVCHRVTIHLANQAKAEHTHLCSTHSSPSEDEGVCLACLWTTLESNLPTAVVSLPFLPTIMEGFAPAEMSHSPIHSRSSRPERAPPLS